VKHAFYLILTISLGLSSVSAAPTAPDQPGEKKTGKSKDSGLPGFESFLQCSNFTWMHNCKQMNEWVSENPEKPVRIKKDGVEFYFPPGTPSTTIDWVLNQTPEALERYLSYLEALSIRNRKSAEMYENALEARGGNLRGDVGLDYFLQQPPAESVKTKINQKNVSVYVFVDSRCTACATYEPRVAQLRAAYPDMSISILQVDNDRKHARDLQERTGVRVTIVSPAQFAQYKKNVRIFPTTWVENLSTKKTTVLPGSVTFPELARQISKVSK